MSHGDTTMMDMARSVSSLHSLHGGGIKRSGSSELIDTFGMKRSFKVLHDDADKGRQSSDVSADYSPSHALQAMARDGSLAFNAPLNAATTNGTGTDPDTQEYADTTQIKRQYLSQDESSFHMFNLHAVNAPQAASNLRRPNRTRAPAIDADPDLMNS